MNMYMFSVALIIVVFTSFRGQAVCPEPPTGVMAEAVGANGIRVTWELPFDTSCIQVVRVTFNPGSLSVSVSSRATEFSAEAGLTCNTVYTVTVVAFSTGDEATSEGVSVIVGGPRNVSATAVSSTSVHLTWEPPASPCNESIIGYQVTYEYSKCGLTGGNSSQLLDPGELEYTFDGLEEDTEYVFTLVALGSGGTETMTSISVRTLTAVPTGPPQSVSVTLDDHNSVSISWTMVECIKQNGPITHYVVRYSSRNGSLQTAETTGDNYSITGLNPDTKYTIQVAAGNVNGIGPFNEPAITITTKGPPQVFQLKLPMEHCTAWSLGKANRVIIDIQKEIANAVSKSCNCTVPNESIATGKLSCQSSALYVTYRSMIIGTQSHTAEEMLSFIEDWVFTAPTIMAGPWLVTVDPLCTVHISSFTDPECPPPEIRTLENEILITRNRKAISCIEKCGGRRGLASEVCEN